MKKNGAEIIHLATCFLVGYPPCPSIGHFTAFIEEAYGLPVALGTHPIPQKYMDRHERLPFWQEQGIPSLVPNLMDEPLDVKTSYN